MRLRAVTEPDAVREAWQALERPGSTTVYQAWAWCDAWRQTVGAARGIRPVMLLGEVDGAPQFLLPLQIRRSLGSRLLEWQAWPHISYGYGLHAPDFLPQAAAWFACHEAAIVAALPAFDCWNLHDMPERLNGHDHPLARLFNLRGANSLYAMDLAADFHTLHEAKRSGETRRSARKRDAKLQGLGSLDFGLPARGAETHAVLEAMFADQQQRLAEANVHGVFEADGRAFIHRLAEAEGPHGALLRPYALRLNGKLLSVMLGAAHGGCYWALISSLAAGPERKHSPGDMALRRTIEACCDEGLTAFDFASGDTAYKRQWADRTVPLHSLVKPVTVTGTSAAAVLSLYYVTKRLVKRTPVLRDLHRRVRGWLPRRL